MANILKSGNLMIDAGFEDKLDEIGKRIMRGLRTMERQDPYVEMRPTKVGYHLCVKIGEGKDDFAPFVQIWAPPLDRLETRFHYVDRKVYLSEDIKRKIQSLLEDVHFSYAKSKYGNMRLIFEKVPNSCTENDINKMMSNLRAAITLIASCPRRSPDESQY